MPTVSRLTGVGTFLAYDFDEVTQSKVSVGSIGTAFAYEFDENVGVAVTLTGSTRMRFLPGVGIGTTVVVFDSINEIDPIETTIPTTGLQLYIDPGISTSVSQTLGVGQSSFTTAGTFNFTVPNGVTSISAVAVGAGGGGGGDTGAGDSRQAGGGGALSYSTSISVTPGETLTVVVGSAGGGGASGNNGTDGGNSSIARSGTTLLLAEGGKGGTTSTTVDSAGGSAANGVGDVKYSGGTGGRGNASNSGGGGGAAGYAGNGGAGGYAGTNATVVANSAGGAGGQFDTGSGSQGGGGGGGVGLNGAGATGTVNTAVSAGGGAGSGGTNGSSTANANGGAGGAYGGGGGSATDGGGAGANGAVGGVRIIWGSGRSYPSTNTADQTTVGYGLTLTDLSGNARNATSVNGAYYLSSNSGIVNTDGTNDYFTVTGYKGVTGTGARTSIFFFKTNTDNISPRLFGWGTTTAGSKWNISLDATTYEARVEIGTGVVLANASAQDVEDTRWHMVASSAPASGTANDIKLYIDGELITDTTITSGATAINTASSADVSFGASIADTSPGYLNGSSSMFLIYNVQLTDFEIKQIYRTILNRY